MPYMTVLNCFFQVFTPFAFSFFPNHVEFSCVFLCGEYREIPGPNLGKFTHVTSRIPCSTVVKDAEDDESAGGRQHGTPLALDQFFCLKFHSQIYTP